MAQRETLFWRPGPVEGAASLSNLARASVSETMNTSATSADQSTSSPQHEDSRFTCPKAISTVGGRIELPPRLYMDANLRSLRSRAFAYARTGIAVHFRGPAGTGKTTLALQVAGDLGRPVSFIAGDMWLSSAGLVGQPTGEHTTRLNDRFVQRVTRSESRSRTIWSDSVVTTAIREGHTLVYDEFTRSPAATNNVLLSVLEERVITLATALSDEQVIPAHPEFRILLTSNPEDYAGVVSAPDALLDRMITFDVVGTGPETEAGILQARTGISEPDCRRIIAIVQALRGSMNDEGAPSLRTAILIGRLSNALGASPSKADEAFVQICLDVLGTRGPRNPDPKQREHYETSLRRKIVEICREARETKEGTS